MSFANHCIKGIPTVKGFPLSNVLEGQQPTACYGWKVEPMEMLPFLQDLVYVNLTCLGYYRKWLHICSFSVYTPVGPK